MCANCTRLKLMEIYVAGNDRIKPAAKASSSFSVGELNPQIVNLKSLKADAGAKGLPETLDKNFRRSLLVQGFSQMRVCKLCVICIRLHEAGVRLSAPTIEDVSN